MLLLQQKTTEYLSQTYKSSLFTQIPPCYTPTSTTLTLTLKLDLSKLLRTNNFIATSIIFKFPSFHLCAEEAIKMFMNDAGLGQPENGLHLIIEIVNCPLPVQNIRSGEFLLAGFQLEEGVMGYLRGMLVTGVGQQQMYLFSGVEIWSARCQCSQQPIYHRHFTRNLLTLIQTNSQQNILKSQTPSTPYLCPQCSKPYSFLALQNQIYLNCQKIRCQLPKSIQKQSIFQSTQFQIYGEVAVTGNLKIGDIVSCCVYMFCRPVVMKIGGKQAMAVKTQMRAFLISVYKCGGGNQGRNCEIFYQLGKIGVNQVPCQGLSDTEVLLENYQNLIHSLNKFHFSYIPPSMLTTLKLALLNSLCTHYQPVPLPSAPTSSSSNTSTSTATPKLHLCLITQDLPLILQLTTLTTSLPSVSANIRRFPSDYDNTTISNWLKCARGCIVILVGPNKKDLSIVQEWMLKDGRDGGTLGISFWVICESNPKKEINLEMFGVVLDLTAEKNMQVCRQAIQEAIDLKLSAFVPEQFDFCPPTITKPRSKISNPIHIHFQNILTPYQSKQQPPSPHQLQLQQTKSKKILQNYYLKCRDLKKTSPSTLTNLYNLAKGFSYFRSALQNPLPLTPSNPPIYLSILDSILAIFLDEESTRHKYSASNTIFGIEISKLILNQQQCQISFWEYLEKDDGMLMEEKNYMRKGDMFKRMVLKLDGLLREDTEEVDFRRFL